MPQSSSNYWAMKITIYQSFSKKKAPQHQGDHVKSQSGQRQIRWKWTSSLQSQRRADYPKLSQIIRCFNSESMADQALIKLITSALLPWILPAKPMPPRPMPTLVTLLDCLMPVKLDTLVKLSDLEPPPISSACTSASRLMLDIDILRGKRERSIVRCPRKLLTRK